MNPQPAIPSSPGLKSRRLLFIIAIVGACFLILIIVGFFVIRSFINSGITKGPDNLFGDQHLKTSVALIELHKLRHGKYPDSLLDLKFTGQWDQIALQNVRYYPSADRNTYYIEVERGWIGKPSLEMPDEFWKGTGYSSLPKPKTE